MYDLSPMSDLVRFFMLSEFRCRVYLGTRNGDGQLNAEWVTSGYLDRFTLIGKRRYNIYRVIKFRVDTKRPQRSSNKCWN